MIIFLRQFYILRLSNPEIFKLNNVSIIKVINYCYHVKMNNFD